MKKLFAILALIALLTSGAWADFSRSQVVLHPVFPGTDPFLIEISGIWPSDCHPGEQKPVVESFDGHTVEIEFEIIVIHITCNTADTPFRVLVDMSEAVRETAPQGDELNVKASFGGATLDETVDLVCPQDLDCENLAGEQQNPEPGLYYAPDLANQGLLLARLRSHRGGTGHDRCGLSQRADRQPGPVAGENQRRSVCPLPGPGVWLPDIPGGPGRCADPG